MIATASATLAASASASERNGRPPVFAASASARVASGSTHAVTRVRVAAAASALQCHSAIAPQPTIATRRMSAIGADG
jgi:hypothetical protein